MSFLLCNPPELFSLILHSRERISQSVMASIESLLNPVPGQGQYSLPSPTLTTSTGTVTTSRLSRQKRQKVAKDAPIFTKDKIRGKMRYPPCEERDEELTKQHREFQIFPMGNIADYPRHIPYNSDKKTFQEKTGRESFEGMSAHACIRKHLF